jgi:predicted nuclease with TOPRIM domain
VSVDQLKKELTDLEKEFEERNEELKRLQKARGAADLATKIALQVTRVTRGLDCQMVRFQTKNTDLGKFWRVLQ